ncbi:MAG: CGGC domain-containing protein [Candidatus Melainabacteria bacterium GWA2_34_9]|nr:MAG: CGGC domain-containing protein [Candidatus Melainabacteria bacterium GWA2_34_9]
MKVGLIRCMQTEDMCPATTCIKVMQGKKLAFESIEGDIELIGINTCAGCPGKKVITRVAEMIKRGADTIAFASCMKKGTPIGFPCPHFDKIYEIAKAKNKDIKFIDWTH